MRSGRVQRSFSSAATGKMKDFMVFAKTTLVHTDEAAPVESTGSLGENGSMEPDGERTRSSAGEHPLHTGRVAGSIPAASTIPKAGVYLLFHNRQLVYVGRSGDCSARIASHRTNGRPFDHSLVISCPADEAEWVERAMVKAMEPVQNRVLFSTHKPPRLAVVQALAPALAESPLTMLNKTAARDRARACGVAPEFEEAVKSGALAFRKKNPAAPKSNQSVIPAAELMAWCERVQAVKFGVG